ncbi:MAG TPA: putative inorganic carbon transporter subunit DabA, partial [Pseudomonadales bacterium]
MQGEAGHAPTAVEQAIAAARHILPDQGPIGVFIHHNTLHHFQTLRFHDAVKKGAELIGARPYMELRDFRDAYAKGRIDSSDVDYVLDMRLGAAAAEQLLPGLTRRDAWRALMIDAQPISNPVELDWLLAPQRRPLLDAALAKVDALPGLTHHRVTYRRHADVLRALGAGDPDVALQDELVRLSAAFLDQGQALTPMPEREQGFLRAAAALYAAGAGSPRGCPGVARDFVDIARAQTPALAVIDDVLRALGVEEQQYEGFIVECAAALAGWAGMFARLEQHPEENHAHVPVSLNEFLAVRFVLARRAIERICKQNGLPVAWRELLALAPDPDAGHRHEDAMILLSLAEAAGLDAQRFAALADAQIMTLWHEVLACPPLTCRELWMEAYEHWYYRQTLNGIAALRPERLMKCAGRPRAQYMFCMDEREESIRRAVEEHGPCYQTFGLAGFFGVAIDYQGLYDHR